MRSYTYVKCFTTICFLLSFSYQTKAQDKHTPTALELDQLKMLRIKVEAHPEKIELHRSFIDAFGKAGGTSTGISLDDQYKIWIGKHPQLYAIPYAIGEMYAEQKNPKAILFLLRANKLKPNSNEAWNLLKGNAYFTNNLETRQQYMQNAMQYDPKNAQYAFDYARSFEDTDAKRADSLYLDVARRFPDSEFGADALYNLAELSATDGEKIAYFKQYQLRNPDKKSYSYKDAMTYYFDLLLNIDPARAYELGLEMALQDKLFQDVWHERLNVASRFLQVQKLMTGGQPEQALTLANKIALDNPAVNRHIRAEESLALLKARAADAASKTSLAYDSLSVLYSKVPTDRLHTALFEYGQKLGKDSSTVAKQIWKLRSDQAKKAKDFQLENYLTAQKLSLADYKGKIILVTYWFPLCTPCRMEFPHFESVLKKADSTRVAYLGLNVQPSQDLLVMPFLKETGYSFTPLRDDWKREKGNLAAPGAPSNYLIDQQGRIIFSNFRIDTTNERTLELMIKETLASQE